MARGPSIFCQDAVIRAHEKARKTQMALQKRGIFVDPQVIVRDGKIEIAFRAAADHHTAHNDVSHNEWNTPSAGRARS
jgi:hypothetical protein